MTNKESEQIVSGVVVEALPATTFRVEVDGLILLCHLSGKMRMHRIRVNPGDRVSVKLSPDGNRGIVVRRL